MITENFYLKRGARSTGWVLVLAAIRSSVGRVSALEFSDSWSVEAVWLAIKDNGLETLPRGSEDRVEPTIDMLYARRRDYS